MSVFIIGDKKYDRRRKDDAGKANRQEETFKILNRTLANMRGQGFKCDLEKRNVILGTHNTEPFAVFVTWLLGSNGEYVGFLTTRWKGKDYMKRKPWDVLRNR